MQGTPEGRKGSSRTLAAQEFHRARRQAAVESILARLTGQPNELLSFEEIAAKLRVRGQSSAGTTQIPVAAIVGSVGRYQDFSRTFLPRLESDEDRWVRVRSAARHISELGPIEVYRVGESYFVVDGNHRVSIARQEGIDFIDAYVTDVRTRVPLPPGASPKDLIIAAEYAAFLEFTRLDELRPDADLRVSEGGQYYHLENHIEAFRYITEETEGALLGDESGVTRWYDEAYLPLVQAIREQMILRYFPGRTETDFFVWLSRHRAALQNELGWAIAPDVAVQTLLEKVEPKAVAGRRSLRQRLAELVVPDRRKVAPPATWAEQRALARYTEHLFANILLPIPAEFAAGHDLSEWPALQQAMNLAAAEEAQLCGLYVGQRLPEDPADLTELDALRQRFNADSKAHGLTGSMALESGDIVERVTSLAPLNDLIVIDRDFGRVAEPPGEASAGLLAVLRDAGRPVLVVGQGDQVPRRAMLIYDGAQTSAEALFVAGYLAERWGVELVVFPRVDARNAEGEMAHVRGYAEMHEIHAHILPAASTADAAELARAAADEEAGLIIISGRRQVRRRLGKDRRAELVNDILGAWTGAVLVTA